MTFFDTANVYGDGAAEAAWGEILADYPRDSYVLATKLYFPMGDGDRGLSRAGAQAARRLAATAARRPRRPLPVPPLRRRDAAGGDDGGAVGGRRGGQGPLHRLLGVDARPDRGGARDPRRRAVRLLPAAVLAAAPRAGERRRLRPLPPAADLERDLVPAGAGRADRQVPARPGAAARLARGRPDDGRLHRQRLVVPARRRARTRPAARRDRRRARPHDRAARARVGAARRGRRLRDRRRQPPRAGPCERRRLRCGDSPPTRSPRSTGCSAGRPSSGL